MMKSQLSILRGRIADLGALIAHLRFFVLIGVIIILGVYSPSVGGEQGEKVTFAISHWSDVNGQLERFKLSKGIPQPCQLEHSTSPETDCTGGFASLVNLVRQNTPGIKEVNEIVLTPGNFLGAESGWLSILQKESSLPFKAYGKLIHNHLKPHAMTLGYEDLRYGWENTLEFLTGADAPVIISNLNISRVKNPHLRSRLNASIKPYQIFYLKTDDKNVDFPIAIVGFVDPSINELLDPIDFVPFDEVIPSLRLAVEEAKKSFNMNKINTVIVLGNGGLEINKKIIEDIPEVKMVISGYSESSEAIKYPLEHNQGLIVTSGQYGSSVGKLKISLDVITGKILSKNGTLLSNLLNSPTESDATNSMSQLQSDVLKRSDHIIGHSEFGLKAGAACINRGCSLGNVVADAMAHCISHEQEIKGYGLSHSSSTASRVLALWNSGSLTKGDHSVRRLENIREIDVHKWLPYMEWGKLTLIKGQILMKLFEASASMIGKIDRFGSFLHVSSDIKVHYVTSENTNGNTSLGKLLITFYDPEDEFSLEFKEIDPSSEYLVVIPHKILDGMGPYGFMKEAVENKMVKLSELSSFNLTCLISYIKKEELLNVGYDERIFFDVYNSRENSNADFGYKLAILILSILLIVETVYLSYWVCMSNINPQGLQSSCCCPEGLDQQRLIGSPSHQSEEYNNRAIVTEFDLEEMPCRSFGARKLS